MYVFADMRRLRPVGIVTGHLVTGEADITTAPTDIIAVEITVTSGQRSENLTTKRLVSSETSKSPVSSSADRAFSYS